MTKSTIRKNYDILGRYGGEEFIVIMPDSNLEGAETLAERIRKEIEARPIKDIAVTVSIGVTHYKGTDNLIEDIIKRADEGLYEAKNAACYIVVIDGIDISSR